MELRVKHTFLEPERIIKYFNLELGDHVADFGAGHGYFTIPMARIVGGDGKVFAIDIQKEVLDIIRAKAKIENLLNIEVIWGNLDILGGSKLKDKHIDFVLVSNLLFQADNKETILQEAYRILRDKGRLATIEWDDLPTLIGPPQDLRVSKNKIKELAEGVGFRSDREFVGGSHHYGLLFVK